jgi:hypothetical protein
LATLLSSVIVLCTSASRADVPTTPDAHPHFAKAFGPIAPCLPGVGSAVEIDVLNPTDRSVDLLCAMQFVDEPQKQVCRKLSLPPRSRRVATTPLVIPKLNRLADRAEVRSMLIDQSDGRDIAAMDFTGAMTQSDWLTFNRSRPVVGLIADAEDEDVKLVVAAMRRAQHQSPDVLQLDSSQLSQQPLDAFDVLVISTDEAVVEEFPLRLRDWLLAGGRLWIMLDKVSPDTVANLLGDSFDNLVIDEVEKVNITIVPGSSGAKDGTGAVRRFSQPVNLVRVLTADATIHYSMDGWPAAFSQSVGGGEVLFTTLGARAWLTPKDQARQPADAMAGDESATEPLATLGIKLLRNRSKTAFPPGELREFVNNQVGYSIVSRASVAALLLTSCAAACGAGLWLASRNQLERLVWFTIPAAVCLVAVFLCIGRATRMDLDSTVLSGQFVRAFDHADQVRLTGMLAAYARETSDGSIGAKDCARLQFESPIGVERLTRQVWSDCDSFYFQPSALSPGLHLAAYEATPRLPQPIVARATFDSQGLAGQIWGAPYEGFSDALIATQQGNLAVDIDADGKFRATSADALPSGEYVLGDLISDNQRNRAIIYQRILNLPATVLPQKPCFLAWAHSIRAPITVLSDVSEKGAALFAMPLVIERPAADARIQIPFAFLPFDSVPDGNEPASTAYDNAKRQWIGPLTVGGRIALRFQLPKQALPVQLVEGDVRLSLRAPGRTVKVSALRGSKEISLASFNSPSGLVRFRIADAGSLGIDDQGGLRLLINVGRRPDERVADISTAGWRIEELRMDLSGVAIAPRLPMNNPSTPTVR